jgi:hypothetical protein
MTDALAAVQRGERSGGARHQAHGVAVLTVPDQLARHGGVLAVLAAQLADDPLPAPGVDVDTLAGERRATTVRAAVPARLERPEAATQQQALELLDVG